MKSVEASVLSLGGQKVEEKKKKEGGEGLKGVGLYKAVRVFKELDQIAEEQQHKLGLDHQQHHFEDDNAILLPLEQVWAHDQLHYEGTHALDRTLHKVLHVLSLKHPFYLLAATRLFYRPHPMLLLLLGGACVDHVGRAQARAGGAGRGVGAGRPGPLPGAQGRGARSGRYDPTALLAGLHGRE